MSYQERLSLVNVTSSILITIVYCAYMIQRFPDGDPYSPAIFHFWGAFFLFLILVAMVAKIVIHILFSIVNTVATREFEPSITDERDKLIEQKAQMNSTYVFVTGFLLGMVALVASLPPSVLFIVLLCAGLLSDVVSELSKFYFYRRGF